MLRQAATDAVSREKRGFRFSIGEAVVCGGRMKITRRGARADNGPSSITLSKLSVVLAKDGSEVSLQDNDVADFVTKAHYNYDIRLSLNEVGNIIKAISDASTTNEATIAKEIGPHLRHLMKLSNICVEN